MDFGVDFHFQVVSTCWLTFAATWVLLAMVFRRRFRRFAPRRAFGLRLVIVLALVIAFGRVGHVSFQVPRGGVSGVAALGDVMCILGLGFAIWARVVLGANWGMPMTVHEDPQLVTSGPYRWVRHPIYTGLILMLAGTAIVYPHSAAAVAAITAYWCFCAWREERDMEGRFPDAYPEYRKRTKMLIPFVV